MMRQLLCWVLHHDWRYGIEFNRAGWAVISTRQCIRCGLKQVEYE
jgi:hypothetical protein